MGKDIVTELGVIDISKDVIANLAGLATMECVGVVGVVSTRAFTDGLGELLGRDIDVSKNLCQLLTCSTHLYFNEKQHSFLTCIPAL